MKPITFFLSIVLSIGSAYAQGASEPSIPTRSTSQFGSLNGSDYGVSHSASESIQQIQSAGMWDTTLKSYNNYIDGGQVSAMLAVGDTLYIAGDFHYFDTVECWHIVQYNRRTKVFSKVGNGFERNVYTLAWWNGKLYAGGEFTHPGFHLTSSLNYLAVFDGTTWTQVGGGVNSSVLALAIFHDTLYVGGDFTMVGSQSVKYLAGWDGSTWTDESNGLNGGITALYSVGDSLFIGGNFSVSFLNLRRVCLLYQGSLTPLGAGLDSYPNSLVFFHDTLWVGGNFYWTDDLGQRLMCLGAWDGSNWDPIQIDTNYGTGNGFVSQVMTVGDTLYVLGIFSNIAGIPATGIARYTGGVWKGLPGDLYGYGNCAIEFDGKLWVGGRYSRAGNVAANGLATFDGIQWHSLASGSSLRDGFATLSVNAVAADKSYIYFGGQFTKIGNAYVNHIAAWDKTNHIWVNMASGVDGDVTAITIYGNNVYVGGSFYHAGSVSAQGIAKWDENARTWSTMGNGAIRVVRGIAADATGVYADVFLQLQTTEVDAYMGRWDGTKWNLISGGIDGFVDAVVLSGGNLYISGNLYSIDKQRVYNVAYYDGTAWNKMGGGFDNEARALCIFNNNLYAGGVFINSGSASLNGVGMWDGSAWQPLGAGLVYNGGTAGALAFTVVPGGLYVGGFFSTADGTAFRNLAMWDGTSWSDKTSGTNGTVDGLAFDSTTNQLAAVGGFNEVGTTDSPSHDFGIVQLGAASVKLSQPTMALSLTSSPNPFTTSTTFHLTVLQRSNIHLEVFDELGRSVAMLNDRPLDKGSYDLLFNAYNLPAGAYMCVLKSEGSVVTQKLILEH